MLSVLGFLATCVHVHVVCARVRVRLLGTCAKPHFQLDPADRYMAISRLLSCWIWQLLMQIMEDNRAGNTSLLLP